MFKKIRQYLGLWQIRRMVASNWVHLAGVAWQGYRGKGKGCVIFALTEFDGQAEETPLYFVSLKEIKKLKLDNLAEAVAHIHAYDPKTEIVLVIELPAQNLCLRLHGEDYGMMPPEALKVHQQFL